jgi:hypothetical protein
LLFALASFLLSSSLLSCPLLTAPSLQATPASHPDAAGLALALQKVDEITAFLNEQKRKAEDFSRILALHDKLTGKLSEEFKGTVSGCQWSLF